MLDSLLLPPLGFTVGLALARRALLALLLCLMGATAARAQPIDLDGHWFELPDIASTSTRLGEGPAEPVRVSGVKASGGRFQFEARFTVAARGDYVLDFTNSSVIGLFVHRMFDEHGRQVFEAHGGIQNAELNPYFLRHARELSLLPGRYRLVTELDSPFYLAQPQPYLDTEAHYRLVTQTGNAVTLLCMGVLLGLGVYYGAIGIARRGMAECMYALFIVGNVLYNATALLLVHDLLQLRVFYLISLPILLSNMAHVLFVRALLEITPQATPRLHALGGALLGLLGGFALMGLALPHWSLELCRIGVALFLLFGLGAGMARARAGSRTAALYLVANVAFLIPGFASIGLARLDGMHSVYLEHMGLVAVTLEVVLLALVQAYRHALVHKDRELAFETAQRNLHIASTDALTGMPNRYALESALSRLQAHGSLTFVDLDGLKRYNDLYGHAQGDRLLKDFASCLAARLGPSATVHRLGGDEFGVTCVLGRIDAVEAAINATIRHLRDQGYGFAGASFGSVRLHETPGHEHIKHVADLRMYEHKQRRRQRENALQTGTGRYSADTREQDLTPSA